MLKVLAHSWPLLLGVMLLMVGNGVQGSLLGIRGAYEGFSTFELSVIMSAYFLGFLGGSRIAPEMIRRVGHVRVFSALGSLISAVLILYPMVLDWTAWAAFRVLIGFCFSGIYVTAESWLNNTASNETRGQALSAYMIVQMLGIISSQGLLAMGDPQGFGLFIIPSVLVSLAFMPILLADTPAPTFDAIKPMSFLQLFRTSPLGCAGMLLTGGVFSAMFGMASVYGAMSAMTIGQIAIFVAAMYVGGLVLQYPIGWLSDRMDRRALILWMSAAGAVVMLVAALIPLPFTFEVVVAMLLGGIINPLYSLLIALTNDHLKKEDMPGASAGLIFLNGFGAIFGPLVAGWLMGVIGPKGYFVIIGAFFGALAVYAAYRITRRASPAHSGSYAGLSPTASSLVIDAVLADEFASPELIGGLPKRLRKLCEPATLHQTGGGMSDPIEILDYWLGEVGAQGWYAGGAALDADIRERFMDVWQAARDGGLEHWVDGTVGTLAYLILCDQLSRNMHRGTADAFATDAQALAAAKRAVAEGWDLGAPEPERQFFYMPFEHSEDAGDQAQAVALLTERLGSDPEMALHARAHQAIIARFGRFPFRNAALGRESSAEEQAFLNDGGYGAMVEALRKSHARLA